MTKLSKTYNLLKTALLFMALIVLFFDAKGQIVYTDIEPDVVIKDTIVYPSEVEYYNLDLNNDDVIDFRIYIVIVTQEMHFTRTLGIMVIDSISSNMIPINTEPEHFIQPFDINDTINNNLNWSPYTECICTDSPFVNADCPIGDKYYGLKFKVLNKVYYGWVRLDVTLDQAVIKDYAFNSTPYQPILAGQMPLNISNQQTDDINVFLLNNHLNIDFNNTIKSESNLIISNILGLVVYKDIIENNHTEINFENFTKGIYLLRLETDNGIITKKFMKW